MRSGFLYFIAVLILLVLGFSLGFFIKSETKPKEAFILTQKVFNEFEGTKEAQKKLGKQEEQYRRLLDSLATEIKVLGGNDGGKKDNLLDKKQQVYNGLFKEFTEKSQQQMQVYNDGLWKQINQYLGEYGREHKYQFIYGASGSGNIMFADSTLDVSDKVIKYINSKYKGN